MRTVKKLVLPVSPNFHDELLSAVRQALFEEWDPIGINNNADAEDEYDSYAPNLTKMLIENKSEGELFAELWYIETVTIGMRGNREATKYFAGQLIQVAIEVRERMNER